MAEEEKKVDERLETITSQGSLSATRAYERLSLALSELPDRPDPASRLVERIFIELDTIDQTGNDICRQIAGPIREQMREMLAVATEEYEAGKRKEQNAINKAPVEPEAEDSDPPPKKSRRSRRGNR